MGCVDISEIVHMVWLQLSPLHLCLWHRIWMGSIPILYDCDVRFIQMIWIAVASYEQFHKIALKNRSRIHMRSRRVNEPWGVKHKQLPYLRGSRRPAARWRRPWGRAGRGQQGGCTGTAPTWCCASGGPPRACARGLVTSGGRVPGPRTDPRPETHNYSLSFVIEFWVWVWVLSVECRVWVLIFTTHKRSLG